MNETPSSRVMRMTPPRVSSVMKAWFVRPKPRLSGAKPGGVRRLVTDRSPAPRRSAAAWAAVWMLITVLGSWSSADGQEAPSRSDDRPAREHRHERGGDRDRDRWGERGERGERLREVMAVLGDVHPDLARRLRGLMRDDPEAARRELGWRFGMLRRLVELRRRDAEMYELRVADLRLARESLELAGRLRDLREDPDADPERIGAVRGELADTVHLRFDVRNEIRELMLARLERQIDTIRGELVERRSRRAELIERHLDDLLRGEPASDPADPESLEREGDL